MNWTFNNSSFGNLGLPYIKVSAMNIACQDSLDRLYLSWGVISGPSCHTCFISIVSVPSGAVNQPEGKSENTERNHKVKELRTWAFPVLIKTRAAMPSAGCCRDLWPEDKKGSSSAASVWAGTTRRKNSAFWKDLDLLLEMRGRETLVCSSASIKEAIYFGLVCWSGTQFWMSCPVSLGDISHNLLSANLKTQNIKFADVSSK